MFTDHNDQFLRNFEQQEGQQEQFQCFTPNSVPIYRSDSMVIKEQKQKSDQQDCSYKKLAEYKGDFVKKAEWSKVRKYSQQNIQVKISKQNNQDSYSIKSEASRSDVQELGNAVEEHPQKSGRSMGGKTYKFQISQIQGAFMKKIRSLQVRIKNMSMNYQTLLVKLRKQHTAADKQNKQIKQYLQQHHPTILQQFLEHATKISQSSQSSFGDSISNKNNDEWMPIMSKIQQLKFDGQKMSEAIKNYQQNLLKKQQVEEEVSKHQNNEMKLKYEQEEKRKKILRKYSIPIHIQRVKKESFQTTMVTSIQEGQSKEPLKQNVKIS